MHFSLSPSLCLSFCLFVCLSISLSLCVRVCKKLQWLNETLKAANDNCNVTSVIVVGHYPIFSNVRKPC